MNAERKEGSSGGREAVSKDSGVEVICVAQEADMGDWGARVSVGRDEIAGEMFMKAVSSRMCR